MPASALATYRDWAARAKRDGGVVTVLPHSDGVPAARYPSRVWAPRVNARQWKLPDAYSGNGEWGYYRADSAVVNAAVQLPAATSEEIELGASRLRNKWLDALYAMGTRAFWLVVLIVVAVVAFSSWRAVKAAR